MTGVAPWVPVEPTTNPAAILGPLPFDLGSVSMPIPTSVVPAGATGILVFAWAVLSGVNSALAYWHFASRLANRGNALSSPTNQGAVEVHGYYPGGAST